MTNLEKIQRSFEAFRLGVHKCGNIALCKQMERSLEQSLNLHQQLEGGYHTHHLEESDSHGWAVADGSSVVGSGASQLALPNKFGSAEDDAKRSAVHNNPGQRGVFSAVMVYPFEGNTEHTDEDKPMGGEPHDSMRFELKLQSLMLLSAQATFPTYFKNNIKAAMQK